MLISLKDSYKTFNFNNTLTYGEYFRLLTDLLKKMSDMILEGEKIQTPFGTFMITKKNNDFVKPGIMMNASMKRKQEIIDRGGVPLKTVKDKDGKVISDNGGEPYLVYFTDDTYYWLTVGSERKVLVEDKKYKFIPFHTFNIRRQRKLKNNTYKLRYAAY